MAEWTEQRIERLKAMLLDGGTAETIALELGGLSRSAVIGKVHRLGLAFARGHGRHETPAAREAIAPRREATKPKSRPAAVEAAPPEPAIEPTIKAWPKPAGPEAVDIVGLDMAKACRMPLWADDEKCGLYCGKPVAAEGSRWCAACQALVYTQRPRMSIERLVASKPNRTGLPQRTRSGGYAGLSR